MRAVTKLISLFVAAMPVFGCINSATYPPTPSSYNAKYNMEQLNSDQRYLIDEPLSVQKSQTTVGRFNAQMIFLADQIERNADRKSLQNTFIVTSFTNLNKLSETSAFGRLAAENLIHELQVRKWRVFEVRLTKDIIMNETGEFSLSRDIMKIKELYRVGGIVTGTYSIAGNQIIVNARVIDINTGLVASSAQAYMPINWFAESLLSREDTLRTMRIVGDTPFSCRDNSVCWGGDTSKPIKVESVAR